MEKVKLGSLEVSRFILGTNPVSGFSHQSPEMNREMVHYFKVDQVKRLFAEAESLGVTTVLARADHFVMRVLMEYWDEGGKLAWIAQTCPELGAIERGVQNAINGGAKACFVHGGVTDNLLAHGRLDEVRPAIQMIRDAGMPAGVAGHNPDVHRWANEHLDLDFHMCSYYNPASRVASPEHNANASEWFSDKDRDAMADVISKLSRPAIHYKVMAAGRNDPAAALGFVKQHLRGSDAVCIGIYDPNGANMIQTNIDLLFG